MSARKLMPAVPDTEIWTQIADMCKQGRVPQAMLLVLPQETQIEPIIDRILTQIMCQTSTVSPCGTCVTCLKILQDSHPDLYYIRPEQAAGQIKIEQIRDIQSTAYQTPQLGERQIFVIQPAEAMNRASASALLKVLEEPAAATMFILISTTPSLLLLTLVSRCQQIHIHSNTPHIDPLALGSAYPESSPRGLIYAQRAQFLKNLDDLLSGQLTLCSVAEQWSAHPIQDMLWFFYTVLVKLINHTLLCTQPLETEYQSFALFRKTWCLAHLFDQVDGLYDILKLLHNDVNLNAVLVLERVLLAFMEGRTTHAD